MKHTRLIVAALAAVMLTGWSQAECKTAVVNMVDLVRFHPNRDRDRKLMMETEKDYQTRLDKQRDRFEELRGEYEKAIKEARSPALNESARSEAEAKALKQRERLADADSALRQEMQKLQRSLRDLDTRLLRQVTGDIREVIRNFAKETRTNIVMDSSTLAYADPELDVTDEILKRMGVDPKKRHEAKAAAGKGAGEGSKR